MQKFLLYTDCEQLISLKELKKELNLKIDEEKIREILNVAINNVELEFEVPLKVRTWKVVHDNFFINLEGPVLEICSIKYKNNIVEPISYTRTNDNVLLSFHFSFEGKKEVIYKTGYNANNIPRCLKMKVIEEFSEIYFSENKKKYSFENLENGFFLQHNNLIENDFERMIS